MIYIYASHYSWMTSDMDAAYAFTSFLESMGYSVNTVIVRRHEDVKTPETIVSVPVMSLN